MYKDSAICHFQLTNLNDLSLVSRCDESNRFVRFVMIMAMTNRHRFVIRYLSRSDVTNPSRFGIFHFTQ